MNKLKNWIQKGIVCVVVGSISWSMVACGSESTEQGNTEVEDGNVSTKIEEGNDVTESGDDVVKAVSKIPTGELTVKDLEGYPETDASKFSTVQVEGGLGIGHYEGEDVVVVIPETIDGQSIVKLTSDLCPDIVAPNVRAVVIPDSVKEIESSPFIDCRKLEVIDFGEGVEVIGSSIIGGTGSGEYSIPHVLEFPESVTTIGTPLLVTSSAMEEPDRIYIPASVVTINGNGYIHQDFGDDNHIALTVPAGSYAETYAKEHGEEYIVE